METTGKRKSRSKKYLNKVGKGTWWLLRWLAILVFPFILLIRGAVWLNVDAGFHVWAAFFYSFLATSAVGLLYWIIIYKRFSKKALTKRTVLIQWGTVVLILGLYCGYTMLHLSVKNAKSDDVRQEYLSLHPLMRMGVGTLMFMDGDLLVTDMSRTHEDYKAMGQRILKNSLHYQQSDGYVHAMDIRTKGRGEVRNFALKAYFFLMGFNTLRHTGTADHLHISLSVKDKPGVI